MLAIMFFVGSSTYAEKPRGSQPTSYEDLQSEVKALRQKIVELEELVKQEKTKQCMMRCEMQHEREELLKRMEYERKKMEAERYEMQYELERMRRK